MKKLILTIIVSLVLTAGAFAQDITTPPVQQTPKPKTIEELREQMRIQQNEHLQWRAQAMQNEYLYLQERIKNLQTEFRNLQAEIEMAKKAQKPAEPKPEPPIDKKTNK